MSDGHRKWVPYIVIIMANIWVLFHFSFVVNLATVNKVIKLLTIRLMVSL